MRLQRDRLPIQVVTHEREIDAFAGEFGHVDRRSGDRLRFLAQCARFQHLLDGVVQPLGVGKHDVVELLASCVVNVSRLQRLQVEPHRRDRGLQLVRDGVDEGLVIFVALDLEYEEHRVDDDAGDDQGEQDDAENQRGQAPGVDQDPADVQRHGRAHKEDAEGYEEADGFLPAGHLSIVGQSSNRVRSPNF